MSQHPIRCKIIDVEAEGRELFGIPLISKSHIGKEGTAYKEDGTVTL